MYSPIHPFHGLTKKAVEILCRFGKLGYLCWLQHGECYYCKVQMHRKGTEPTVEHKIPLCRGGKNNMANCVAACANCNSSKGPLTDAEFIPIRDVPGQASRLGREIQIMLTRKLKVTTLPAKIRVHVAKAYRRDLGEWLPAVYRPFDVLGESP
jgi:hypothetical protein